MKYLGELLNRFVPNSQERRVFSLAWTSLNVKVKGQRSRSPGTNFLPIETHTRNHFAALFPGPPGWAGTRRELLDFMVRGKINRGRHTDHPAGRHSIQTNQCSPPPSPSYFFTGRMPFLSPSQQRQLVSWSLTSLFSTNMAISEMNQQRQSTEGIVMRLLQITSRSSRRDHCIAVRGWWECTDSSGEVWCTLQHVPTCGLCFVKHL